jgi:vancomycin resistance protein YoaR
LNLGFGSPSPQFDVERQEGVLRSVAEQLDRPSRDADIRLNSTPDGPVVVVTPEQTGIQVLVEPSARRLRQALAQGVPATVELALETEQPKALASDFAAARSRAERMLAEPVVLTFEERRWTIAREDVARMLTFERAAGQPAQVLVNPSALDTTLQRIAKDVDQPAMNARFAWTGSSLRSLRESQDGRTVALEGLRTMIRDGLLQGDEHSFALPVSVARPAVTTADAPKINVQSLIREGRTSYAGATAEKAHNVALASSRLNGVVVPPGGLFSFNREVGPTTLDAGFRTGWGITQLGGGARTVPSVAGGICQVATTLFQPVFRSGYMIEERNYHLYWINSYGQPPYGMKGLDATVDEDANLDFKFTNNTADYLLISSRVEGATLIFGLWGVKPSWDVKIDDPVITNVVTANTEVVNQNESTMPAGRRLQVESAQDGFTSVITRTVSGAGQETRTLRLTSRYQPARNVVLIGTGPG